MAAESEIDEWNETMENRLHSSGHQNWVIFRTAGILTILGAGYIIQDIAKDAARRKPTKNRIMLFMSSCDFLHAFFSSVIGPAMVPKEIGVPGAVGNQLTCDVQGFLLFVTGLSSGLYNVSLALCYLIIVRYEYSDERLRVLEPYFLYLPVISCLVVAIAGLPFGIYNFNGTYVCFIYVSPLDCDAPESPIECERGEKYSYWLYLSSIMIVIGASFIIFSMVKMYTAVLQRERSGDQFRFSVAAAARSSFISSAANAPNAIIRRPSSLRHRNLSRKMRSQGLWYSGAFLFTFSPLALDIVLQVEFLMYVALITAQLIGFTNAVIYVRPKLLKFRRDYRNIGFVSSIWYTLTRKRPAGATTSGDRNASRRAAMTESSSLRVTLDRFSLRVKSLFFTDERRDLSDPASIEQIDVIDSIRQDVPNTGNESSFVMERLKCKKNDVETVKKDVESNNGSTFQNQNTLENIESEITEKSKDEVDV
jgi:hypothetical protein